MANLNAIKVPVATGIPNALGSAVPATVSGDAAETGHGRFLYVNNAGASSRTVTLATPGTVAGIAVTNPAIAVAAGQHALIPLPTDVYGGPDGRAAITYDAVTSLTVAVFELPIR